MEFARADIGDLDEIMKIIEIAIEQLKKDGIDQWQNNYPNHQIIKKDINDNNSYVLKDKKMVLATASVSFDGEDDYINIYNGKWLSDGKYGVIHRMAVDFDYRGSGLASIFLREIEKLCTNNKIYSIKVDTHRDNEPMKKLLLKNEYIKCGVIYLKNKSKRIALEKLL